MGHLEGNFTPVLYMGRKVPKGQFSSELGLVSGGCERCNETAGPLKLGEIS